MGRGNRSFDKKPRARKNRTYENKDLLLSFGKKKAGQRKPVWGGATEVLTKSRTPGKTEPTKNKDLLLSFGKKKAVQRKPVWDEATEVLTKSRAPEK